jgi:hypothetical protein
VSPRHDGVHLYDTRSDPTQQTNLAGEDRDAEDRLEGLLTDALDAPESVSRRLGIADEA